MYIYVCIVYIYICVCIFIYVNVYVFVCRYLCIFRPTFIYLNIYIYTNTYIQTYIKRDGENNCGQIKDLKRTFKIIKSSQYVTVNPMYTYNGLKQCTMEQDCSYLINTTT